MKPNYPKQAFLLLCNRTTDSVIRAYRKLYEEAADLGEVLLLYHLTSDKLPEQVTEHPHYSFRDEILTELNYLPIGFSLVPGNNHFPLLKFYLEHPHYDYYWCIEEDVRFSGQWMDFFEGFSDLKADFISSHLQRSTDVPNWYWWDTLAHPYMVIPFEDRIRSFNPIYRISNKALNFIHQALLSRWCGHHEVLFPTLLAQENFEIMDFGGKGEFVRPGFEQRFYSVDPNTMRWRPTFQKVGDIPGQLYHPVKD